MTMEIMSRMLQNNALGRRRNKFLFPHDDGVNFSFTGGTESRREQTPMMKFPAINGNSFSRTRRISGTCKATANGFDGPLPSRLAASFWDCENLRNSIRHENIIQRLIVSLAHSSFQLVNIFALSFSSMSTFKRKVYSRDGSVKGKVP